MGLRDLADGVWCQVLQPVPGGLLTAALLAGLGAACSWSSRPILTLSAPADHPKSEPVGQSMTLAVGAAALAGLGVWLFVGGTVGLAAGAGVAVLSFRTVQRAEPGAVRREREAARRELPHLIGLLIAPLRAGASIESALEACCRALPGPAARRFDEARRRLALGVDPATVWERLARDGSDTLSGPEPELAALGRALTRSAQTGASVVATLETLAQELAARDRAAAEDAARQVGVRAALPLGLCLLPAFLLLGIVPVVAGLLAELTA